MGEVQTCPCIGGGQSVQECAADRGGTNAKGHGGEGGAGGVAGASRARARRGEQAPGGVVGGPAV